MSAPTDAIVWVHGDCLSPDHPGLTAHPGAPALFVFDDELLQTWQISLKRVVFIYECLLELPVTIRRGDPADVIERFAAEYGARRIVTTASPSPRFRQIVARLRRSFTVEVLPVDPFFDTDRPLDLGRFSRYWSVARRYLIDR
jgi:deoxyribodipyrimidine photolyase